MRIVCHGFRAGFEFHILTLVIGIHNASVNEEDKITRQNICSEIPGPGQAWLAAGAGSGAAP
jgi:hypothetical protein